MRSKTLRSLFLTYVRLIRSAAIDPKRTFRVLQSSPKLGPTSYRFYISEAAVRGRQFSANAGHTIDLKIACRRPVSKYSRHRPAGAQTRSFSKADANDLTALVGTRCGQYFRSSINRDQQLGSRCREIIERLDARADLYAFVPAMGQQRRRFEILQAAWS